jgi:hypothetical protein
MRFCFFVLAFGLSFNGISQSLCGTAGEGGSVTLTAPAGKVFTSVTFASYGTPNGSCGSFTIGGCHAANSQTIVASALIGNNSATIPATNGVFGDPCAGTVKRLYIEAVYSSVLPLRLISFSSTSNGQFTILQWLATDEVNTQAFDVQRSTDGLHFSSIGSVASTNNTGTNLYSYTDNSIPDEICFYRLKMIDQDGSFTYSKVVKVKAGATGGLTIFPNPVTNSVNISGLNTRGYLEITTLQGATLKRIAITDNTQTINMANYAAGMYILKYTTGKNTVYQKLIKQ